MVAEVTTPLSIQKSRAGEREKSEQGRSSMSWRASSTTEGGATAAWAARQAAGHGASALAGTVTREEEKIETDRGGPTSDFYYFLQNSF